MGPPGMAAPEQELRRVDSPPPRHPPSHTHPHPNHCSASPLPRQQRKGAAATRAWLVVPKSGTPRTEELGKHSVMRRTGIPARDLRILDPVLSYPSTVLGRERAIVVKLECIKAIITATEVLVPNYKDPLVEPFVRELELRLSGGLRQSPKDSVTWHSQLEDTDRPLQHSSWGDDGSASPYVMVNPKLEKNYLAVLRTKDGQPFIDRIRPGGPKVLPFEFRALEICLDCACSCLEKETSALEQEAYPALDALTSKICTLNLERVRQIKSRLVLLSGRVHKVRDEFEHLLDDDMDMAEMHLTEKLAQQQPEEVSSGDELDDDDGNDDDMDETDVKSHVYIKNKSRGSTENLCSMPKTEDLEMLLEAYFVRAEGTVNKLSAPLKKSHVVTTPVAVAVTRFTLQLRDYVDDTEDYINIMLDDKQNQLLQMGVVLSTATLILSAGIVIVGLLGMNIHIPLFDTGPKNFWETAIGCAGSCVVVFVTAVIWGKRSGIIS